MAAFCSCEEDGKMLTSRGPSKGHAPNPRDSTTVAVVGYVRFYRESLVQSLSRHPGGMSAAGSLPGASPARLS
jgi:hypothetical protein